MVGPLQDFGDQAGFADAGGVYVEDGNSQFGVALLLVPGVVVEGGAVGFDRDRKGFAAAADDQQIVDAAVACVGSDGYLRTPEN